jgi:Mycobacterial cell wall arabinan synthesis protein
LTEPDPARPPGPPTRVRFAQGLAFLALIAALVGALGPAERVRTTYSWPPATLPDATPESAWYTPLLLSAHRPESIAVTLPCAQAPALAAAEAPTTVLATARRPERVGGLEITRVGDSLDIALEGRVLHRLDLGEEELDGTVCAFRLHMADGTWALEDGAGQLVEQGAIERLPFVSGLFSDLDARSAAAPSVELTTAAHATRVSPRQTIAWIVAALAALGSLVLVSIPARVPEKEQLPPRPRSSAPVRAVVSVARPVDAVIAVALVGWWVISPAYIDDGWVTARERMFGESRGFSYYYSTLAANLPLDYWLDWAHHWLSDASSSLLVGRIPALMCLAAVWLLCRYVAVRLLGDSFRGVAEWTLAAVFLMGAFAWGMTLRPEPVTAVVVTAVTVCMLLFRERGQTWTLAAAAVLVPLALSGHPAGIVSLAAVLVVVPDLLRWVRPHAAAATAIVAASLALLATLLFVGADIDQRRYDGQLSRTYSFDEGWRDEVLRYTYLSAHHYGTPLRRASVALIVLTLLAFLFRRRRGQRELVDFPALVLAAGMLLLVATPSKWPSHFGTLIGVAAIAAACEAARIRAEGLRATRWHLWPFAAIGAVTIAVGWAWLEREDWNIVDLRTLDWTPGFESWLPVARLAVLAPLIVLCAAFLAARRRRVDGARFAVPWRVTAWAAPLVAVPLIAFTVGVLVADTAKTDGWTLAGQNLDTIAGLDPRCGLGEDLLVPVPEEASALAVRGDPVAAATPAWAPPPPTPGLPAYALGPSSGSSTTTPWFELPAGADVGIFVAGATGPTNRLLLEWGRAQGGDVVPLRREDLDADTDNLSGTSPWRLLVAGDLPEREATADAVRVVHTDPGAAVAVTAPVTYGAEPLADRLRGGEARSLVLPNALVYFPCARLPVLREGTVEVPDTVVAWENPFSPIQFPLTSPFAGLLDLYALEELSTSDSPGRPSSIRAYRVDRLIEGAELAPPDASTS